MQNLERAYIPDSELTKAVTDQLLWFDRDPVTVLNTLRMSMNSTREQVQVELTRQVISRCRDCEHWRNDTYQVAVFSQDKPAEGWPRLIHLSIKRNDRQPIHDWRDLQEIKNQLVGPDHEAVELYPAESRRVDTANQYHLWVLADPIQFPFGFTERCIAGPVEGSASKQRPFEKEAA